MDTELPTNLYGCESREVCDWACGDNTEACLSSRGYCARVDSPDELFATRSLCALGWNIDLADPSQMDLCHFYGGNVTYSDNRFDTDGSTALCWLPNFSDSVDQCSSWPFPCPSTSDGSLCGKYWFTALDSTTCESVAGATYYADAALCYSTDASVDFGPNSKMYMPNRWFENGINKSACEKKLQCAESGHSCTPYCDFTCGSTCVANSMHDKDIFCFNSTATRTNCASGIYSQDFGCAVDINGTTCVDSGLNSVIVAVYCAQFSRANSAQQYPACPQGSGVYLQNLACDTRTYPCQPNQELLCEKPTNGHCSVNGSVCVLSATSSLDCTTSGGNLEPNWRCVTNDTQATCNTATKHWVPNIYQNRTACDFYTHSYCSKFMISDWLFDSSTCCAGDMETQPVRWIPAKWHNATTQGYFWKTPNLIPARWLGSKPTLADFTNLLSDDVIKNLTLPYTMGYAACRLQSTFLAVEQYACDCIAKNSTCWGGVTLPPLAVQHFVPGTAGSLSTSSGASMQIPTNGIPSGISDPTVSVYQHSSLDLPGIAKYSGPKRQSSGQYVLELQYKNQSVGAVTGDGVEFQTNFGSFANPVTFCLPESTLYANPHPVNYTIPDFASKSNGTLAFGNYTCTVSGTKICCGIMKADTYYPVRRVSKLLVPIPTSSGSSSSSSSSGASSSAPSTTSSSSSPPSTTITTGRGSGSGDSPTSAGQSTGASSSTDATSSTNEGTPIVASSSKSGVNLAAAIAIPIVLVAVIVVAAVVVYLVLKKKGYFRSRAEEIPGIEMSHKT